MPSQHIKNQITTNMSLIRLTREFSFEMSHALQGYDGPCSQIHGHSYRLFVTVRGVPSTTAGDPKEGMVIDFRLLKNTIDELVIGKLDHALLLRESEAASLMQSNFSGVITVPFQPTCENLIAWIASLIVPRLPHGVELFSLRLHETANSFAEWFAEDNK